MKRAWMPLYVGDYLGDTGHLTTSQHGAYFLLMMHYWRTGGLPSDDKQLATITKLPFKIWMEYRETIQAFFHDGWQHKRINQELNKMEQVSLKRAAAGYKGGIHSAMGRMRLEVAARRPSKSQASAKQLIDATPKQMLDDCLSPARPLTLTKKEREEERKGIPISSELVANIQRTKQ